MKRFVFVLAISLFLTACDSEPGTDLQPEVQEKVVDSIQNYEGNFISVGEAAVLKGDQFVFQVKMDSVALDFKQDLENYELQNGNIVPVEVKGKILKNPSNKGYSQLIEIKEVTEVFAERKPENKTDKN